MSDNYTSDDIQELSDRDHVRKRTQIYLGSTNRTEYPVPTFLDKAFGINTYEFVPAVYKSFNEIVDNSIDELTQLNKRTKSIQISGDTENGIYGVKDNGRGIPIDKREDGRYTPQVALGSLRAGRNFNGTQAGVIGQNGVGSACTNYCSESFDVRIIRDRKEYTQSFRNGADNVSKPKIKSTTSTKTGTEVQFKLDREVFTEGVDLPADLVHGRAMEIAFNNPGMTVTYNDNQENYIYKYPRGFEDVLSKMSKNYYKFESEGMEWYVVFDLHEGIDEQIFTWVNSSLLFEGGKCNTQFLNAFTDQVSDTLKTQAKKMKCEVTKNDVRRDLLVFGILKVTQPEYDSQSKTRLTGPDMRLDIKSMLEGQWKSFARQGKEWFETVLKRATDRHHSKADKEAMKDLTKGRRKKVVGLTDATSRNRYECKLIVTEGLSAAGMIDDVRDPKTVGSLPLSGKINNVYGARLAEVLKMGKIEKLIQAIGLVPGQKAVRSDLRYGQVWIAPDADPDGDDIMTLLSNLFYKYWPELMDPNRPFLFRLVAPNVVASKGKGKSHQRIHFANRAEYEKKKTKYKTWQIDYYKGLGSMIKDDWQMILSDDSDTLIPLNADAGMSDTMELLFGENADARKAWLSDSYVRDLENTGISSAYINEARRNYALYVLSNRAIPALADGLKPAARRVLWTGRNGEKHKSATLAGATMPIHPHASPEGTINTLAAFYGNNIPLLEGSGAFGTLKVPDEFGASRYTSVKVSKFTKDVVFKDIEIIPMKENYDSTLEEPKHFLPLIPLVLLNPSDGIALGYSSTILPRSLEDLVLAQIDVLDGKKLTPIPYDFTPTNNTSVEVDGGFTFTGEYERVDSSTLKITKLPYGLSHKKLVVGTEKTPSILDKLIEGNEIVDYEDNSSDEFDITVKFKRGALKSLSDDKVIKMFGLRTTPSENLNVLDFSHDHILANATDMSIVEMFTNWRLGWYVNRYERLLDLVKVEIQRYQDIIIAIDNDAGKVATTLKDKKEYEAWLNEIGVTFTDYIATLPTYRFTLSEREKTEKSLARAEKERDEYISILGSERKRKNIYKRELVKVLEDYGPK